MASFRRFAVSMLGHVAGLVRARLGNRTERIDHVAERMTTYSYDVDVSPEALEYPTRHNRLLWYEVYSTGGVSNQLLRRVQYTYYDNGQVSNITLKDEHGDPNAAAWHYDLALHYYTHGPLQRAVWGRWRDSQEGPTDYEVLKAREFRYDDPRARYLSVDIATPANSPSEWKLDRLRWTDYEGVTPYGDFDVDPNDLNDPLLSVRYFGFSGERRLDAGDPNDPNAEIDVTYWHEDLIGSIMQTTDAEGEAFVAVSYTAFGEPIGDFSSMPRYQYAGQYGYESGLLALEGADAALPPIALQHLGWRWYQPDIGRFVQRDPIGVFAGRNFFAYSNPLSSVDPTGLLSIYSGDSMPWSWGDLATNIGIGMMGGVAVPCIQRKPPTPGSVIAGGTWGGIKYSAEWGISCSNDTIKLRVYEAQREKELKKQRLSHPDIWPDEPPFPPRPSLPTPMTEEQLEDIRRRWPML